MLTCCKATKCKFTYGCTSKFDLIAQHPEPVLGLFLEVFLRAESPPVEQQTGKEITTGVSACNCSGKVKRGKTIEG